MPLPKVVKIPLYSGRTNRLLNLGDLRTMPRPKPLISGVLFSDMEHVLFGPQGVSKTFLLIDWALHMAYGRRWMGRESHHGRTLIVCGEGGGRVLADRLDAWLTYHEISDDTAASESIRITEYPVPLLEPNQTDELLEMIREERNEGGFDLIAFDTLIANFGPGNENEQKDMAAFLYEFRRIRLETSAGVLCVHHTGHVDRTRPQGANALRRNVDIELRVDRDSTDADLFGVMGGGELKARHGQGLGLLPYRLEAVDTGSRDATGESVYSCVIAPTQDIPNFAGQRAKNDRLGKNQQTVLRILRQYAIETNQNLSDPEGIYVASTELLETTKAAGMSKQQTYDVRKSLLKRGWLIEAVGGFKWFPNG